MPAVPSRSVSQSDNAPARASGVSSSTEKALAQQRFDERAALLVALLYMLSFTPKTQVAPTTFSNNIQRRITLVILISTYLFCKYAPNQTFSKYRNKVLFIGRTSYFILPMTRGSSQFLRHSLATTPYSKLWDVLIREPLAIIFGTQVVGVFLSAHMFALPMRLHMLAQVISISGVINLRPLCSTQLLSSERYRRFMLVASQSLEAASKTVLIGPSLIPSHPEDRCCTVMLVLYILFTLIVLTISLMQIPPPVLISGAETNSFDRWLIRLFSHLARPHPELSRVLKQKRRHSSSGRNPPLSSSSSVELQQVQQDTEREEETSTPTSVWASAFDTVRRVINWWLMLSALWTLVALAQHNNMF